VRDNTRLHHGFRDSISLAGAAEEADVCSEATWSDLVPAEQEPSSGSPPVAVQQKRYDLSSRLAEARSFRAVVFDKAWLERIKRGRQHTSSGNGENKICEDTLERRVCGSRISPSVMNSVVESMRSARHLDDAAALGVEVEGDCAGNNNSVLAFFPRWSEDRNPLSLAQAWKEMAEDVARQGRCGIISSSSSFKRPWYSSQLNKLQVWTIRS